VAVQIAARDDEHVAWLRHRCFAEYAVVGDAPVAELERR
jgi:hypothetical protein